MASHVFSSIVYGLQHDAAKDLVPVGLLTTTPTWIIATNTLPAKDLKELVAWLKSHPDDASAGIVGHGSPAHRLAREQSLEEAFGLWQALVGEDNRSCSACRVRDVSLLMKPIQRVPVVTFPDAHLVVAAEEEKCQHGLVNLV